MPYKDKMKQLANNRLWKQNKKNRMNTNAEIPPVEIPVEIPPVEIPVEIETRRLKQKLQKQKNRTPNKQCLPCLPEFSPKIDDYSMEEYRYDILYSVIQLREIMLTKTRYNYWMNKHLLVLDELHERFKL